MEFSRQQYWSVLPFPTPGYLANNLLQQDSLKLLIQQFLPKLDCFSSALPSPNQASKLKKSTLTQQSLSSGTYLQVLLSVHFKSLSRDRLFATPSPALGYYYHKPIFSASLKFPEGRKPIRLQPIFAGDTQEVHRVPQRVEEPKFQKPPGRNYFRLENWLPTGPAPPLHAGTSRVEARGPPATLLHQAALAPGTAPHRVPLSSSRSSSEKMQPRGTYPSDYESDEFDQTPASRHLL